MKKALLIAALLATTSLLAGCVVSPGYYAEPVYVEPPPPRVEYPGYPPITGYLWIGGYWTWTGHRHEWVPGRWDAPRPGYRWAPPRWERDGRGWRQHEGRWEHDSGSPHGQPRLAAPPRVERQENHRPAPVYRPERDGHPGVASDVQAPRREVERRLPPGVEQRDLRESSPVPRRETSRVERHERGQEDSRGDRRSGRRGSDGDR